MVKETWKTILKEESDVDFVIVNEMHTSCEILVEDCLDVRIDHTGADVNDFDIRIGDHWFRNRTMKEAFIEIGNALDCFGDGKPQSLKVFSIRLIREVVYDTIEVRAEHVGDAMGIVIEQFVAGKLEEGKETFNYEVD